MEFHIFTEPQQGATYEQLLAVARRAEELGFAGFFRSDHYLAMGGADGQPGPTDAWITLAGLARETTRIRLGTLVTSATFRLPGPLAVAAAQVDAMSGGRVEFGLGAGWFVAEHDAYGIEFPDTATRFAKLEEQLEVITGLWTKGAAFEFTGEHYRVSAADADAPAARVAPFQSPHPPIIIGGKGKAKTPALAVRFADEFNVPFSSPAESAELFARVGAAKERAGRTRPLRYSAAQVVCTGVDEASITRRAAAIGREPAELRENGLAGLPDEVRARVAEFAAVGTDRIYLQLLDLTDLDHLSDIAAAVGLT